MAATNMFAFLKGIEDLKRFSGGPDACYIWIKDAMINKAFSVDKLKRVPRTLKADMYLHVGNDGFDLLKTALCLSSDYVRMLIQDIGSLSLDVRYKIYTSRMPQNGFNALQVALLQKRLVLIAVLLANTPASALSEVLLGFSRNGLNAFMMAIVHQYDSAIEVMLKTIPQSHLKTLYEQRSQSDDNVLMLASRYSPTTVSLLLEHMPAGMTGSIFRQQNVAHHDVVAIAMNYHPELIQVFYEPLKLLSEQSRQNIIGSKIMMLDKMASNNPFLKKLIAPMIALAPSMAARLKTIKFEGAIPDKYICPISGCLMTTPVLFLDGHHYDKKNIDDVVENPRNKSIISPVTGSSFVQANLMYIFDRRMQGEILDFVARQERMHLHQPQLINAQAGEGEVPENFTCPIGLDVMCEPVLFLDGHHYEKKNIDVIIAHAENKVVSPLTREEFDKSGLMYVPDEDLRAEIQQHNRESSGCSL